MRTLTFYWIILLVPAVANAQATSGAIAGVVRDATGGVLPGVSVEASSTALIEKIRNVVTDEQGQYRILDLRPGIYTVEFRLAGFTSVRREGLELTTGFTANVNVEMRVGALDEAITVTGASPVVDVQSIRQQSLLSREVLDTVPTGKTIQRQPHRVRQNGFQQVSGRRREYRRGAQLVQRSRRPSPGPPPAARRHGI